MLQVDNTPTTSCVLLVWMELKLSSVFGRTSISANADGPRDAALRKIDHIALPTERRSIADYKTKREMSVINTDLNDNAQTPLGRFVVDVYTTKFATNTVTNRTSGA